MEAGQRNIIVAVAFSRVWVGKGAGDSRNLFINLPGKDSVSGGKLIGQVAIRYSWMEEGSASFLHQIEIQVLTITLADGRTYQVADQELIYTDLRGMRAHLYPSTLELGDIWVSYNELEQLLRPRLNRRQLSESFELPRLSLRWSRQHQVLTDGYTSFSRLFPQQGLEQYSSEVQLLARIAPNQDDWDSWLGQLEGKLWEDAQAMLEAALTAHHQQATEAAVLRQIQAEIAQRPRWEGKAIRELENFFQKTVPIAEQKQQAARVSVRRGAKTVHVVYRPGKSPSVYLFDNRNADQASLLVSGQIHPGAAAKHTIGGRAIRKVGKVTLVQAVTHQAIRHLANLDK